MRNLAPALLAAALLAANAGSAATTVTIAGSFQTALGCPENSNPACPQTQLVYHPVDDVWQGTLNLPAGSFGYFAAIDGTLGEVWGANADPVGTPIPLALPGATPVKFYYDDHTHWLVDSWNGVIAVAAGNFQSEVGCPGDWQPDCLVSWLQDPDGDGIYRYVAVLPGATYEALVPHDESWTESYGVGGALGGGNVSFTVAPPSEVVAFEYDAATHVLTITAPEPGRATLLVLAALALFVGTALRTAR